MVRTVLRRGLLALLAGATLGACGATPAAGERLTLQGTLVLRGNEPHTSFVLLRADGQQWELQDLAAASGRPLQNREVRVTGIVARPPGAGLRLPALRVTGLRRLP